MKKFLFATVACFLAVLSLPACSETDAADPNALTVMGKRTDLEKTYMSRIFELYEQAQGEKLNIVSVEDAEYETVALAKMKSDDAPDILLHFHNADLSRFNIDESFYMLGGERWADDLTDSAAAYCRDASGRLLGLPFWESSVSGCYYNKTLLEKSGLGAAVTQADFDGLCAALAENGQTPICWPANGCSWMYQFGLDPVFADDPALLAKLNRNETVYAEIPAVTAMMQWIANAADRGWFGGDYLEVGWEQIGERLASGEAAMTFIWDSWFYTDFKPGKYTVDDFALMPAFLNTTPEGTYEGGNLNMMMVNKNSDKLEKALGFLDFCATPENYNRAFDGIATVSCFKGMTSNIRSQMVTDAQASIARYERVSTAVTKIVGYSADDVSALANELFRHKIGVAECVAEMDKDRIGYAREQGIEGF